MPAETLLIVCGILAVFAFFAGALTYADMTWKKPSDTE